MRSHFLLPLVTCALLPLAGRGAELPPAAARAVDFQRDIQPLFEAACVKCHAKGKDKGGFSLETRAAFLKGGDTGAGAVAGRSADSLVVELVAGLDPDSVMPKKGTKWTPEQVGLLRAWIDQGLAWPDGITFAKPPPENLHPHTVALDPRSAVQPVDDLVGRYFAVKGVAFPAPVDDRTFARRAYLDTIGLLPAPEQLDAFLQDSAPDKRAALVRRLLADQVGYANHWLTFWNDLLRNDYKGTGFIDGGRKQISGWLYKALIENLPYDQFVAQLVNPTKQSEGFTKGIIWRGNVNASMLPPMQAAQNVSQVFMGVNLKCASCHDSFINDWSLSDAYGLAAIYAEEPMELVHCDKPTGKQAAVRFLYPEVGGIDAKADRPARLQRLAELLTSRENGRLSRTIVNRLWARLLGRGLVDPLDDMEQPAWSRDLLDWLAEDFVAHGYDLKHTIATICASATYALPTVEGPAEKEAFVFRGPLTRRLTAEQFADALSALSGDWNRLPSSLEFDFGASGLAGGLPMPKWIWTAEPWTLGPERDAIQAARPQLDAAVKLLADAEAKGGDTLARAAAAVAAAQAQLAAATAPRGPIAMGTDHVLPESDRHEVIFRKKVTFPAVPAEAYGAVLASQRFTVQVNGREAKAIQRDGFRNGRIVLIDLKPLLVAGENLIVVNVSSHTEKQVNDVERPKYPGATTHLNEHPGLAFYARCEMSAGPPVQIISDETWRVRRSPGPRWNQLATSDTAWALATPLPPGASPIDEGPSLKPITRRDFANLPVELGPQLSAAVSTAAHVGEIRAALLAADPLQVALDRPNREIVVPQRATAATTIQALELTNGTTLNTRLQKAAMKFTPQAASDPAAWLDRLYQHAFTRRPTRGEQQIATEMLGIPVTAEGITDLLWAMVNLPEFQLIN